MLVGTSSLIMTSTDGVSWTSKFSQGVNDWYSVHYLNNKYFCLGSGCSVEYSSDGNSWSICNVGKISPLNDVLYVNNQFIAVGNSGTIVTSENGDSWLNRLFGSNSTLNGIAYGNNVYVAVGNNGIIYTSPDSITWTKRTSPISESLNDICYSNDIFVSVGDNGTIITSSDGLSWSAVDSSSYNDLKGICGSDTMFVAVGASGTILYSSDALNWNTSNTSGAGLYDIQLVDEKFVVVGAAGTIKFSTDCITWSSATVNTNTTIKGKQLEEYQPEADIVRWIFKSYLNGMSTAEIAREMSNRGVLTKGGKEKWKSSKIAYMLSNERYVGDSKYQKTYRTATVPFTQYKNRGEEDMYYATETHIGLIDRETFEKVQTLLKCRRERFSQITEQNIYPLTSHIRCSECGSSFHRRIKNGSIKWVCAKHNENAKACNSFCYNEERIYDGFVTMVNKLRYGAENIIGQTISLLETAANTYKMNNQTARNMSQSIAELNAKLLMLDQLQGKGYLANEVYQMQTRNIRKQINELKLQRQDSYESKILETLVEIKKIKALLDEIDEPLEEFDQKLFEQIVCEITISRNDELTITLIGGLKFTEII